MASPPSLESKLHPDFRGPRERAGRANSRREMIFDGTPADRVPVDACVPLDGHLPRAAAKSRTHPSNAVKRKNAGCRLFVYQLRYIRVSFRAWSFIWSTGRMSCSATSSRRLRPSIVALPRDCGRCAASSGRFWACWKAAPRIWAWPPITSSNPFAPCSGPATRRVKAWTPCSTPNSSRWKMPLARSASSSGPWSSSRRTMRWPRRRSWPLPMTASIGPSCAHRTRIWRSAYAATASFSSTGARARCATNRWCGKNSVSRPRRFPIGWRSWATARMATLVCPAGAPDLPRPCSPAISISSRFPSWPRSGTCPCAGRCGWPRRSWNNASASCSSGSLPRCARTRPSAPTWTRCAGWDRELSSRRGRSDSARRRYTSAPRYWRQRGLVSCRERTAHDRSVPLDVRQLPRRRLDGRARFQQHRRRVPRPRHELVARPVGHGGLDDAVAEEYLLLFHVHRHRGLRLSADGLLEPLEVGLGGDQAGNAEHHAVAEEDLAEGAADDGADAPAHEGLGAVLAR